VFRLGPRERHRGPVTAQRHVRLQAVAIGDYQRAGDRGIQRERGKGDADLTLAFGVEGDAGAEIGERKVGGVTAAGGVIAPIVVGALPTLVTVTFLVLLGVLASTLPKLILLGAAVSFGVIVGVALGVAVGVVVAVAVAVGLALAVAVGVAVRVGVALADEVAVAVDVAVLVAVDVGVVVIDKPAIYQTRADGSREAIDGAFVLAASAGASREVGLRIAAYDRSRTLVIDPGLELVYSSYIGGGAESVGAVNLEQFSNVTGGVAFTVADIGTDVAIDSNSHAWVSGVA
jgi:hypothetical protein